jgi:hypothetical protein
LWSGIAIPVGVVACHDVAKDETASLAAAIERFRLADDSEKYTRKDDIERVKCTVDDVCKARDACVAAADELNRSNRLRLEVKISLAKLEQGSLTKDDAEAKALPQKLDESEALLKSSRAHMTDCDTRVAALQAAHK